MHKLRVVLLGLVGVGLWAVSSGCGGDATAQLKMVPQPVITEQNPYYVGNKAPLQPLHFLKLPIGSIQPTGWLKKYLELQRDGLTGHLGEISAWLEKKDNAWLDKEGKGGHGWEEVPYWLKGYGDLAYILKDSAMLRETKIWIEAILRTQRPDGYFGPLTLRNGKPDLWPNMIALWCLQSYYDYSKDARVIPFMAKYFKWEQNLPDSLFLKDYWENSRGGDNLYSVYWLYNRTGDSSLLTLAEKIHRNTANWRQADNLPNWHNVNIAQSFREPATFYMQSGDSADLKATYRDFHIVRDIYGQVPGGMFGADENARPGYTDPHQAVETCGMVEQMASDEMLLRFTGDPFWADHCEDVAFNTYPAAVMPDFKSLRYLTAPNMVVSDNKNHSPGIENNGPFLMMNPFSSRCCQHNHTQGWPYYAENLWMATPDKGLAAVLYSASTVTAKVGDGTEVHLTEETHYPFEEQIAFTVHTPKTTGFPIYLRIPGWCKTASVQINGKPVTAPLNANGYARLEKAWKDGDKIVLQLPMEVQLKTWTKNKNSTSVNYGPLSFSLKIKEKFEKEDSRISAIGDSHWQKDADPTKWPAYNIYADSPWNYGLVIPDSSTVKNWKVRRKGWAADSMPFTPESVPLELVVNAKKIPSWKIDEHGLCGVLPQSPVAVQTPTESVTLIPMGATRLRIASFPVIKEK
ncbi:MAG TPA: beta-L-arabinofuranosidase domain-containing protein [Arachidicoccus sp.]|nr:beta-L-arabinofuranosidase domain-containing protein [Arachidicoccus sp.]